LRNDSLIEKQFLYLLGLSLLLHLGVFALVFYLPQQSPPPAEPVFIDLQEMPELKNIPTPTRQEVKRQSDQQSRVQRETAPKGTDLTDRGVKPTSQPSAQKSQKTAPTETVKPGSSIQSLLKSKSQVAKEQNRPQLFPGASRMAQLEDTYRRRFEKDIAEGDTKLLNSNDVLFGSFLRRFENAVYGVWVYPLEAARNGIEGITPVRITFNRKGDITNVRLLESSGARILDDEVLTTLNKIKQSGGLGSLPKGYEKDEFNLIAFFQYGGSARKSLR
jgi:periplasmic protein TonB